jgi:2-keto-4-pentenoate hydratase/2-oxohepta-3-ene-1,7-dioic acid hydratase in catechol pathway
VRVISYWDPGHPRSEIARFGIIRGQRVIPWARVHMYNEHPDDVGYFGGSIADLIAAGGREEFEDATERAAETETGSLIELLRPAPAIPRPGKIVCVGLNYRAHVTEGAGRDVPDRPLIFAKFANAVVADGEPIVRPAGCHALDLEVELGVVIGSRASRVSADDAMGHVAGYVVVNDVSARDWQGSPPALLPGEKGDGQWLRAKGSDTFLPMGPVLVTTDEVDPSAGLRLRSWRIPAGTDEPVLMQDGSTADLLFSIPELIAFISASITLDPGDVIATGTPAGVGVFREPPVFLEPGDRVRCEIEGIGSVENAVVDGSTGN